MTRQNTLATLTLGLFISGGAMAARTPVDILIQRLVEKKVLAPADADEIRAEIAQIEKEQAEGAKSSAPEIRLKHPVKLSGYTQIRYRASTGDGSNDRLEARRVRLTLSAQPTPALDLKTQVDFAGSRRGRTGESGSELFGRPVLLDAVARLRLNPTNQVQIGQFKIPFGSESPASDTNLELINRAAVTEALAPGRDNRSNGRDIGIQYGGSVRGGTGDTLEFTLGLINGGGINTGDDNDRKDIAARVEWRPELPGLSLGASLYDGRAGANNAKRDRQGLDILYRRAPWLARAEHIWARDGDLRRRGYYGTLAYSIVPRTQVALRYDRLNPDSRLNGDATGAITLGLTRLLSTDGLQRWQLNYERRHGQAEAASNEQYLAQIQMGF